MQTVLPPTLASIQVDCAADHLRCQPKPVEGRRERPAGLGNAFDRRFDVALHVLEADLADERAAGLGLDRPVAVAEQRPGAGMAQEADPATPRAIEPARR